MHMEEPLKPEDQQPMSSLPHFTPEELVPEDEAVLEAQGYEFTDEEVAEIEAYADSVEADWRAGRLQSAESFFAELERTRRRAS